MKLAAQKFGWNGYQRRPGHGRGFAFARYNDSGEVVNPDGADATGLRLRQLPLSPERVRAALAA